MHECFATAGVRTTLSAAAAQELAERGFTVVTGPTPVEHLGALQAAYDLACATASAEDARRGRTSLRVTDFVNRGPAFDALYTDPTVLCAAHAVIGEPFRLSAMHARTLVVGAAAEALHVDVPRTSEAWPMLGAIIMIDAFRPENGATRFLPGSHRWHTTPDEDVAQHAAAVSACGPIGSVVLFHASTWHGHGANTSTEPRRSVQMTFVPRAATPATDFVARMDHATRNRLGPIAHYLLGADRVPAA